MLSITYVLSQFFVIINYVFLIATYQIKDNKKILLFNTIACTFSGISFFLLKGYSGCVMSFIAVFRNILFAFDKKNKKSKNIGSLIFVTMLILVLSIFTCNDFVSCLPSIGTFLYTLSIWFDNKKIYRLFGIPIEICWLSYHISLFSIFGILLELVLFASVIIGILKKDVE